MKSHRLPLGLAILVFASPYFFLLARFPSLSWPEADEFLWALKNTLIQATGSAVFALVSGFILMLGLWRLPQKGQGPVAWALLTPSFFPPLFLLLSFLSIVEPFPTGLIGIIAVHGFMNAGLVAVALSRFAEARLGGVAEAAFVCGASRLLFFRRSFGLMRPAVLSIGAFVFAASFASFSIPLVVGGGRGTTLEILIYEKIRITNDWGQALSLSLAQLICLGVLALLPGSPSLHETRRSVRWQAWGSRFAVLAVAAYLLFFWGPLFFGIPSSLEAIQRLPGLGEELLALALPSLGMAVGVGFLCLLLFLIFAFGGAANHLPRFFRGWVAPSTALLGFVFLFAFGDSSWGAYAASLSLLFFPAIYRLGMDRHLESLSSQIQVARVMGASDVLIWWRILVPQVWPLACLLAGVAALWTLGDFALGKLLLGGSRTWALLAESLMSSYRIEAGLGLGVLIFASGLMVFLFFWRLGHVRR